jgi:hypothetical protein
MRELVVEDGRLLQEDGLDQQPAPVPQTVHRRPSRGKVLMRGDDKEDRRRSENGEQRDAGRHGQHHLPADRCAHGLRF